jgi:hypothetical protein
LVLASFARLGIEAIGVLREAGVAADAHVWLCRAGANATKRCRIQKLLLNDRRTGPRVEQPADG